MTERDFCVITFPSTHFALRWEKQAKKNNISIKIIPVPRQISSSCGLAGRFSCNELQKIEHLCREHEIPFENIFRFNSEKSNPQTLK